MTHHIQPFFNNNDKEKTSCAIMIILFILFYKQFLRRMFNLPDHFFYVKKTNNHQIFISCKFLLFLMCVTHMIYQLQLKYYDFHNMKLTFKYYNSTITYVDT